MQNRSPITGLGSNSAREIIAFANTEIPVGSKLTIPKQKGKWKVVSCALVHENETLWQVNLKRA